MSRVQEGILAGLALGAFCACLLVLFAIIAVPTLATAGVAAFGVGLGMFAAALVTFGWAASRGVTDHFLVTELA